MLTQYANFCDTADAFFEIADLHAYTTEFDNPQEIRAARNEMVAVWLAAGVDPQRSTIFLQSAVPEIGELHVLLSMITPVSWLERVPTYKGQIDALGSSIATYGFLGYPLLQLCDIAIVRGEYVPVGRDQQAHLEFGREVIRRFNHLYGDGREILVEPQATLSEFPEVPGTDGRKMSKSYGNADLHRRRRSRHREESALDGDRPAEDSARRPGPSGNLPGILHCGASSIRCASTELPTACRSGALGCVQDKSEFADALNAYLRPIRERYATYRNDPAQVERIIEEGTERTRAIAAEVLADVKRAMKLT